MRGNKGVDLGEVTVKVPQEASDGFAKHVAIHKEMWGRAE